MRFVCESCRAQYMINDEKVGPKGVKVRCRKCGYVILVKRGDAGKAAPAAASPGGNQAAVDPDDGLATQVMQNPLTTAPNGAPGSTLPGNEEPFAAEEQTQTAMPGVSAEAAGDDALGKGNIFGAVDEDEIGAVFDQVLNSGAHSIPKEAKTQKAGEHLGDDNGDRESTRVLDAHVVQKLAEESGGEPTHAASFDPRRADKESNGHSKESNGKDTGKDEVPQTDWFVAIDEKQTGPLALEKMKEHWDRGEIGPDSLCWRAGFTDWVPVSEVAVLASVLAPRPTSKPIMMAVAPAAANVVSVPVESAFSAGGMTKTVRSEVPMSLSASPVEETGTWRPSAAGALASQLREEMKVLNRAPEPRVEDPSLNEVKGLLDLPQMEERAVPAATRAAQKEAPSESQGVGENTRARGPANPYVANPGATYSSPGVSSYRPQSNRNLIIAIAAGGAFMVLILIGLIIWLANKPAAQVVVQQPVQQPPVMVAQAQPPVAVQPSVAQPPVAQPPVAQPPVAQPPVAQPPVAVAPPVAQPPVAQPPVAQPPVAQPPVAQPPAIRNPPRQPQQVAVRQNNPPAEKVAPPEPPAKKGVEAKGGDDFDSVFGGDKKEAAKAAPPPVEKKQASGGYIPPAPGQASNIPDSLQQSDILEVVGGSKPALIKCAEDQRKKEPGVSGKLMMKWIILTSGKTSNVSVQSEEFKSTYMAACVGGLIKSWNFPKHKTQGEPVVFPFKF